MKTSQRPVGRVKASLLRWLGVPISFADGAFWSDMYGRGSDCGEYVTVDRALQLSTVWACTRLLAETISTLPCQFYERQVDGTRRLATEHSLYQLLHNAPNADMTASQFWEAMITAMLLYGDAFAEKIYSGPTLIALQFLMPDRVGRKRLSSGRIEYSYLDWDGKRRPLRDESLLRIPAFSLDGVVGLSAVQYGSQVFGSAMAAERSAGSMFANGMQAAGVLYVDRVLKPEQREQLRGSLSEFAGSRNAGKTFVAEAGMRYEALTIRPEDAQLLETRAYGCEEICRWFRVPPMLVGHQEKSTSWGTGIEQQMIHFLTFSLRPWLTRVEQAIRRCLLTPAERVKYYAEFAIEGLLRADSAGRAAWYATAAQNGWLTRNEIRSLENRPPVPGGDTLTVQSNLISIDRISTTADSPSEQLRSALTAFMADTVGDD